MSAYHDGIEARKKRVGRHENPYLFQEVGFGDFLFNPGIHGRINQSMGNWFDGWDNQDRYFRLNPELEAK